MTNNLLALLQQAGKLTAEQVSHVDSEMGQGQISVPSFLIERQWITSFELAEFLSTHFAEPIRSIHEYDFNQAVRTLNKRDLVLNYQVLPVLIENQKLTLAVSDLTHSDAQDELRFLTTYQIKTILVEHQQLSNAIKKIYGVQRSNHHTSKSTVSNEELDHLAAMDDDFALDDYDSNDAVSRLINEIMQEAASKHASDVHYEPFEDEFRIRMRLDGILQPVRSVPVGLSRRISTRLKILAKLKITERRLPQDGRMKFHIGQGVSIDVRISTLPTLWGEKVVLRLLDSGHIALDVKQLGLNPTQQEDYLSALNKPQGMILITGPTGSGKTVSLYTGLKHLNTSERNISTAEDPIEINLSGINQVNIHNEIGFDFATALRAFLRQDPDVVMVGEIRDLETAEIGIKAAQTGHLVLSTLHTNSAAETITRLHNMGVATYNIAASLSLIIAQRLTRRLCHHCKIPHDPHDPALTILQNHYPQLQLENVYCAHLEGCDHCNHGYSGRVGIYEVMKINRELAEAIANGATAMRLEVIAVNQGMATLAHSGIEKLNQGVTSLNELQRVISL